jgi:hypothetical protein
MPTLYNRIGDDWPPMHVSDITKPGNVVSHGGECPGKKLKSDQASNLMSYANSFFPLASSPRPFCPDNFIHHITVEPTRATTRRVLPNDMLGSISRLDGRREVGEDWGPREPFL